MATTGEQSPRWSGEAARTASDWIAGGIVLLTTAASVLTALTDWVPDRYRVQVTSLVAALGAISAALTKLQGELTRRNVWSSESHYQSLEDQARVIETRVGVPAQPETPPAVESTQTPPPIRYQAKPEPGVSRTGKPLFPSPAKSDEPKDR
jgi:hypothetical protein